MRPRTLPSGAAKGGKVRGTAIVVAAEWPEAPSGYGLALRSSLPLYAHWFEEVVLCAPGEPPGTRGAFRRIGHPYDRSSPALRFLRALPRREPAILRRLAPGAPKILSAVHEAARARRLVVVVYEDLVTAGVAFRVADRYPDVLQVARCHNVLAEVFRGLSTGPLSLAWTWEIRRIRDFEGRAVRAVDRLWTLSARDGAELASRYGRQPDGVFPVALDTGRYAAVPRGDPRIVVHVGSADYRKRHGLRWFLERVWPRIRAHTPDVRLVVAGRGTSSLRDEAAGVEGMGFVQDDRDVLRLGGIFINPQQVGSGVKVKSLIAMAAGRCLVSTPKGMEGIGARARRDCHVEPDAPSMAARIVRLIAQPAEIASVGDAGRRFVAREHAPAVVAQAARGLLATLENGA